MDLDFVSVHKHAKKELGQYPAILTSHLVNNPYKLIERVDMDVDYNIEGNVSSFYQLGCVVVVFVCLFVCLFPFLVILVRTDI